MQQLPLISIILCTYNGERFLDEQIQSLLKQTYSNFNIIICDDASTDSTKSILKKYEGLPNVIIIFNEQNLGFVKNFIKATTFTQAPYLAFSDQDDIWLPHKIETLQKEIGDYSLVYSNSLLINDKGEPLHKKLSDVRNLSNSNDSRNFVFLNAVSGHTMMIKKELLRYPLPANENLYHDWWFAIQAANLSGIQYVNQTLTLYRQHEKTITKTIIEKKVGSRTYSKRYLDFLKELQWIELMKNNPLEKNKIFFEKFFRLYSFKKKGNFVWQLFAFMLRYQNALFKFSKKNTLSRIVEIRKLARGEQS